MRTAAGTELRRHQVDALAGMLTELIAATQRAAEENGNGAERAGDDAGSGNGAVAEVELEEEAEDDFDAGFVDERALEDAYHGHDPGAVSPLPVPPPDGVREDDRSRRVRRGRATRSAS